MIMIRWGNKNLVSSPSKPQSPHFFVDNEWEDYLYLGVIIIAKEFPVLIASVQSGRVVKCGYIPQTYFFLYVRRYYEASK